MTTVKYTFGWDYCSEFFNLAQANQNQCTQVADDFVINFAKLLRKLKVTSDMAIAEAVYHRMVDTQLTYHNPVHILSIFQFAQQHNINLAWWEEIAIWFHNSVYVPGQPEGQNEWASSKFMEAMMSPYVTNNKLNEISNSILHIAYHTHKEVPAKYHIILDLDLCAFAFENPGREITYHCVQAEYPHLSENVIMKGRYEFLEKLMKKWFIFRTHVMQKDFEIKAWNNILGQKIQLQRILCSLGLL